MTDSPQTELHWYVAKTFRRERKIKERLEILGIEHFIPFHKVVKQFGARRVAVEEPIVNGIIFIRYDFRGSIALVNDYGFEMRYRLPRSTSRRPGARDGGAVQRYRRRVDPYQRT